VFTLAVNLLLTPVYVLFLSPEDYGAIGLLLLFSALAKIVFRMGLDNGFFRVYYDLKAEEQPRFAWSVWLFAAGSSTLLFAAVWTLRATLARLFLGEAGATRELWIVLAAADIYLGAFSYVPQSLLRIQDRPGVFSAFAMGRHATNTLLKVALLWRGYGVGGVLISDAAATGLFSLALLPVLWRNARAGWTWGPLKEALAFGLPKVPHGFLFQIQELADRRILLSYGALAQVGLYQQGYAVGRGVKFALSAFEPAWQPFVYSQIGRPDAKATLARVVTYAFSTFLGLGLTFAVLGRELLMVLTWTRPVFWAAAPVIPLVVFAYVLHGVFLLTSIGIGIEKRARYYPVVTAATAATNVGLNLVLIPRLGMMGAAWTTVASYAVMAALGFGLSRRLYPIAYEWGRLGRVVAAAGVAYALSLLAPQALLPAVAVKLLALACFPLLAVALGVLRPEERSWIQERLRVSPARGAPPAA
jgi:O-antigen/teichoic acid export membrane protein